MAKEEIKLSGHALDMLKEREIPEQWVWRTINEPDSIKSDTDNNTHYIKTIPENEGRFLRVVVSSGEVPKRVITLFFDRRLRRRK